VREWALAGLGRFFRQTIVTSAWADAETARLFRRASSNTRGGVLLRGAYAGTLGAEVLVSLLALLAFVALLEEVQLGVDQGLLVAEEGITEALEVGLFRRSVAAPGGVQVVDVVGQSLAQRLLQRRSCSERAARRIVDDLRVDVPARTEHREARAPTGFLTDLVAKTGAAPGFEVEFLEGHYFFLPSFRRICSFSYFTPLPL
jgi:hypothetical protein